MAEETSDGSTTSERKRSDQDHICNSRVNSKLPFSFLGVSSIILENPFYGLRKPKEQFRSSLQQVSDLFVMGAALILESLVIMNFCDREGFSPIIAHGISMGRILSLKDIKLCKDYHSKL